MTTRRIAVLTVMTMTLFLHFAAPGPAAAQDAARVNPKTITVKIDNDRVRVLEAVIPPGYKEALHSHPASVIHVIAGGTMRNHASDGTVSDRSYAPGDVLYREALTHWAENVGKTTLRLIIVELKGPGRASETGGGMVVDAAWLEAHIGEPELVLLHVGEKAGYDAAHIPGARFVAVQDLSLSDRSENGLIVEMPGSEDLRNRLEALGISDDSRIVVYFGKDWISPTTRIIFTLEHAGLGDRTFLLDGGMEAWKAGGGTVTADVPPPSKGKLAPLRMADDIVDAVFVREHLARDGYAVVDARTRAFFEGSSTGGSKESPHRTGHIRGAMSIPFSAIVDDHNVLLPKPALAEVFTRAGVKPHDTVITYCHVGQQATAVLFAARLLGHQALLYDGSFQDWSRRADFPVDNPAASPAP